MTNILLTSSGRRTYLVRWFKQALESEGIQGKVYVSNSDSSAPTMQMTEFKTVSPRVDDDKYVPFIIDFCKKNGIKMIIPLLDVDVWYLSKQKERIEKEGIRLMTASPDMVRICNDKHKTCSFLIENGIKTPRTYIDIDKVKLDLDSGIIEFPLIIKPRWGTGSAAVFEAIDIDELQVLYQVSKRRVMNSFLSIESKLDLDRPVVIQEKLSGEEYGIDVINDLNGHYVNTLVKRKLLMRAGETDIAETVENLLISKVGSRLSSLIRHPGIMDVDVFLCNEEVFVLEMNNRFGGGYPFSHICGADIPRAIIRWMVGDSVSNDIVEVRKGIYVQKDFEMRIIKGETVEE